MSKVENVSVGTSDLVVIGSSAGGVEALSILVSTLPSDFPAPIVLAQHLDGSRPSTLDAILQRRTSLPVEVVASSCMLEPGKIYVVPSNRHVAITDGHVKLQEDHAKRPRPSVDVLFSSAAKTHGEHLIAVILTGSGSDGAAGAVDVKNAGGIVIVQNPQTARYPSMPLALPPTVIDFTADIECIGPLLHDLLTGVSPPQPEEKTGNALNSIFDQVSHQANMDFRPYKTPTILRRIGRRMVVTHSNTMQQYAEYLRTNPEEVGELVRAFLINVTQFFRDPNAFAYLKNDILPLLVAQARERDHCLRIWTAGCATGEEPYSLAMLLTDLLGPELHEWSIKIFATDLDEAAISFARRGLYSENLLKGVPTEYHERFFAHVDPGYQISKMLRQMVIFGQHDLSRSAPFPRIDLVLCRNVLIYFTPELQDYVLNRFAFSLSTGGYLFLGKAEAIRPNQSYYELVNKPWKVYRRADNGLPPLLHHPDLSDRRLQHVNGAPFKQRVLGKQPSDQDPTPPSLELAQLRHFNELLLRFLPIGVAVIDRTYQVLAANGAARRLLGLRDVNNEQDFLHAVRGIPYAEVRSAIDIVFRERNTVTLPDVELDFSVGGSGRFVSLSIAPMQMEGDTMDLATISVTDVTEQVQTRRQLETVQAEQTQLLNELSSANKRLNDVNKELLDANEELQVANEELMLTHEELQASIEEFETTNEELQATNEELETNNEEFQATNEELETTGDELRGRTGELQELATMLESERKHLTEIVEHAPFYIMVLRGPSLIVEAFNPRYARMLEGQVVQGRPLDEVFELFWETSGPLMHLVREAYQKDSIRTTPRVVNHLLKAEGTPIESYFVYTIIPSHDANGKVSGLIIYATDETTQRTKEADQERVRLRIIFDNTPNAALALYDAQTAELIMASSHYLDSMARMHMFERSTLLGRKWHELSFIVLSKDRVRLWDTVQESGAPLRRPVVHLELGQGEQASIWDWSLTPVLNMEQGEGVQFVLESAVDITEPTQAHLEMERLNHLKDDFLALASHELRTPLTSIQGNSELLHRNLKRQRETASEGTSGKAVKRLDAEQEAHLLEGIKYQVNRMNKLIGEMLDITRIRGEVFELKNKEKINIVKLVWRVVEYHPGAVNHPITVETSLKELVVNGDEARLEQVLTNLLSNAFKYSLPGKPVVVGIERPLEESRSNEVIIWVRDEGRGMSEEEQAQLFDRFYHVPANGESNPQGLGLGLYIARAIIVRHSGRIWLKSAVEEGSTFYVSLPLG